MHFESRSGRRERKEKKKWENENGKKRMHMKKEGKNRSTKNTRMERRIESKK